MKVNNLMFVMLLGALALLTGCTQDVALRTSDGKPIGQASLVFDSNKVGTLSITIDNVSYHGDWVAEKVDESGSISRRYGMGSRKFNEYVTGRGNDLWQGKAALRSAAGEMIQCDFVYRGAKGSGTCQSATGSFDFVGEG